MIYSEIFYSMRSSLDQSTEINTMTFTVLKSRRISILLYFQNVQLCKNRFCIIQYPVSDLHSIQGVPFQSNIFSKNISDTIQGTSTKICLKASVSKKIQEIIAMRNFDLIHLVSFAYYFTNPRIACMSCAKLWLYICIFFCKITCLTTITFTGREFAKM